MNTEPALEPATLVLAPLTRDAFAPFGDVIDDTGGTPIWTNGDTAQRLHGLGLIDAAEDGGNPVISLFRLPAPVLAKRVAMMERHPISSQTFVPLTAMRLIVIVAARDALPEAPALRAFVSNGRQGINYHRGVWHYPLLSRDPGTLLVIDRSRSGSKFDQDYDEHILVRPATIQLPGH